MGQTGVNPMRTSPNQMRRMWTTSYFIPHIITNLNMKRLTTFYTKLTIRAIKNITILTNDIVKITITALTINIMNIIRTMTPHAKLFEREFLYHTNQPSIPYQARLRCLRKQTKRKSSEHLLLLPLRSTTDCA